MFEEMHFIELLPEHIDQNILNIIGELSDTSTITIEEAKDSLRKQIQTGVHKTYAGIWDGEVICLGSVLFDYKIAHPNRPCCHLEEICVRGDWQLKGVGRRLIEHLESVAINHNAYKIILDCVEEKACFYEKCGFHKQGVCMRKSLCEKRG